ncbi:RidA family protein [Phreatobacter stygius]|uniref:RidA family protein n=1 Tax=Phreatobacter stygius TaxID=1940610 RepID=A0A4D7AZI6_9HYPH|nr:Rid family hydrolase [Phreatobacter stygius]QCI65761.1 RidA family protein [Phreatobacter stygius]
MPSFFDPPTVHAPAPSYRHGAIHQLTGRRLIISGQVASRPDGTVAEGLEAQFEQAFDNLIAVVKAGGMEIGNLVKVVTLVTVPDAVATFRTVRARKLGSHVCAATYIQVAGLARPDFLVEIEGEAVQD